MTKTNLMDSLVEKMQSPDQDFRFMGLNDLLNEIKQDPNSFIGNEVTEGMVLAQVLKLVEDKISDVKNLAVKCLGQLIKILRENQMETVIETLCTFLCGQNEELRDISGLAVKTIASELPPESSIAGKACASLIPKLGEVLNGAPPSDTLIETLSTLSIMATRFPVHSSDPLMKPQPITAIAPLLEHPRPAVRKCAILTLSHFIPLVHIDITSDILQTHILPYLEADAKVEKQWTAVNLVSAILKESPQRLAPSIDRIVPGVLKSVHRDDDELREVCLQTLETLVLKSPLEAASFLTSIIQIGNQYIKYDPNYTGEDDQMQDDDDDEEEDIDCYTDDEDTSYKIRRAATKLLAAVIVTRPELLASLYKDVSPILISRFGDREETVRLEVWGTYTTLINQTGKHGGQMQVVDTDHVVRGKRKRDSEERMDVEETPLTLLKSQVPSLSKALFSQLRPSKKPLTTFPDGFQLLRALLSILPGSLSFQAPQIGMIAKDVLSQPLTTATPTLYLTCLAFLGLFFSTHELSVIVQSLSPLTPHLLGPLSESNPRVVSETFRTFSALLKAMRPIKSGDWPEQLYEQALHRLTTIDTDAEVRTCVESCIADLWVCATDLMRMKAGDEWQAMCRITGNTSGAVRAVTKVAREVEMSEQWVNSCVEWVRTLLAKSGREKLELFIALNALLKRYPSEIPTYLPASLVPQIKPYITTSDIPLLSQGLFVLAVLLERASAATYPVVERLLLADIYSIAYSPVISGSALNALLAFFSTLARADLQIAPHVILNLVLAVEKSSNTNRTDVAKCAANVAKCIGQVVSSQQTIAAGTIAEYSKYIKKSTNASMSTTVLSLLILGELGRFLDMAPHTDVFKNVIECFSAEEEEIRTAAAIAAGNIATGNLSEFLPNILYIVESDPSKRLLSLYAVKEMITHCSDGQLERFVYHLWTTLFMISTSTSDAEEIARNVAAACLGKLTTAYPSPYLEQLHSRIWETDPAVRIAVISTIRYTFVDSEPSYDDLLAPHIMDFLGLMKDSDLTVRRITLSALNLAARMKPHLVRDHLPALLPTLYAETVVKPDLIQTFQMGPWQHKVDTGQDARKTAWETLYTLLDTCLNKLDLTTFLTHLLQALTDSSDEIKVLAHLLIGRLCSIEHCEPLLLAHLDVLASALETTMRGAPVTKDTVKQDLERAAELRRSTIRAVVALHAVVTKNAAKSSAPGSTHRFGALVAEIRKNEQWRTEFDELVGR